MGLSLPSSPFPSTVSPPNNSPPIPPPAQKQQSNRRTLIQPIGIWRDSRRAIYKTETVGNPKYQQGSFVRGGLSLELGNMTGTTGRRGWGRGGNFVRGLCYPSIQSIHLAQFDSITLSATFRSCLTSSWRLRRALPNWLPSSRVVIPYCRWTSRVLIRALDTRTHIRQNPHQHTRDCGRHDHLHAICQFRYTGANSIS